MLGKSVNQEARVTTDLPGTKPNPHRADMRLENLSTSRSLRSVPSLPHTLAVSGAPRRQPITGEGSFASAAATIAGQRPPSTGTTPALPKQSVPAAFNEQRCGRRLAVGSGLGFELQLDSPRVALQPRNTVDGQRFGTPTRRVHAFRELRRSDHDHRDDREMRRKSRSDD